LPLRPGKAGLREADRERYAFAFLVALVEFLECVFDDVAPGLLVAARGAACGSALATLAMRVSACRSPDRIG